MSKFPSKGMLPWLPNFGQLSAQVQQLLVSSAMLRQTVDPSTGAQPVGANTKCLRSGLSAGADLEVDVHQVLALRGTRQGDVDTLLQAPPEGLIDVPREVGGC